MLLIRTKLVGSRLGLDRTTYQGMGNNPSQNLTLPEIKKIVSDRNQNELKNETNTKRRKSD